jgi:hypothetical protein
MMSSSNDLENMNKTLLENDSQNKLFNCKSTTTHICFLLTIIIIIAIAVIFFTTLY